MPIPAILAAVAGTAVRFVIKRPILSAAGTIIGYEILNEDGTVIGDILPNELPQLESALSDIGIALKDLLGNIGNEILEVLEGAGESIVKGLDNAFEYIKERFIRGKEPDIVAGFTVTILSIATLVYLYNSVKNSNDAF